MEAMAALEDHVRMDMDVVGEVVGTEEAMVDAIGEEEEVVEEAVDHTTRLLRRVGTGDAVSDHLVADTMVHEGMAMVVVEDGADDHTRSLVILPLLVSVL
jgi:hypothetical protein